MRRGKKIKIEKKIGTRVCVLDSHINDNDDDFHFGDANTKTISIGNEFTLEEYRDSTYGDTY